MPTLLLLTAFLPYMRISPLGSDVQPHFLIMFMVWLTVVGITTRTLPIYPLTFIAGLLGAVFAIVLDAGTIAISVFVLPVAIDAFSRLPAHVFINAAKTAIAVLYVGILLNVLAEPLLSIFVSNYRGSALRGLNSFTSEPSYLGILGMTLTAVMFYFKQSSLWVLAAGTLTLLSGSLTAVAPLAVMVVLRFVRGKLLLLVPIVMLIMWQGAIWISQTESRIGFLMYNVLNAPELILLDQSFSNRFLRGVGPIVTAYNDGFSPHNFSKEIDIFFNILSENTDRYVERLSNLFTILVYGFGMFSFPLIFAYFYKAKAPSYLWFLCVYLGITNISIATPYICIALALPLMEKRMRRRKADDQQISLHDGTMPIR